MVRQRFRTAQVVVVDAVNRGAADEADGFAAKPDVGRVRRSGQAVGFAQQLSAGTVQVVAQAGDRAGAVDAVLVGALVQRIHAVLPGAHRKRFAGTVGLAVLGRRRAAQPHQPVVRLVVHLGGGAAEGLGGRASDRVVGIGPLAAAGHAQQAAAGVQLVQVGRSAPGVRGAVGVLVVGEALAAVRAGRGRQAGVAVVAEGLGRARHDRVGDARDQIPVVVAVAQVLHRRAVGDGREAPILIEAQGPGQAIALAVLRIGAERLVHEVRGDRLPGLARGPGADEAHAALAVIGVGSFGTAWVDLAGEAAVGVVAPAELVGLSVLGVEGPAGDLARRQVTVARGARVIGRRAQAALAVDAGVVHVAAGQRTEAHVVGIGRRPVRGPGRDPAQGVDGELGRAAVGCGFPRPSTRGVITEGGNARIRAFPPHEIAEPVVEIAGDLVLGVGDLRQAAQGIVGKQSDAAVRILHPRLPAVRVVLVLSLGQRCVGPGSDATVGIVGERFHLAVVAADLGEMPAGIVGVGLRVERGRCGDAGRAHVHPLNVFPDGKAERVVGELVHVGGRAHAHGVALLFHSNHAALDVVDVAPPVAQAVDLVDEPVFGVVLVGHRSVAGGPDHRRTGDATFRVVGEVGPYPIRVHHAARPAHSVMAAVGRHVAEAVLGTEQVACAVVAVDHAVARSSQRAIDGRLGDDAVGGDRVLEVRHPPGAGRTVRRAVDLRGRSRQQVAAGRVAGRVPRSYDLRDRSHPVRCVSGDNARAIRAAVIGISRDRTDRCAERRVDSLFHFGDAAERVVDEFRLVACPVDLVRQPAVGVIAARRRGAGAGRGGGPGRTDGLLLAVDVFVAVGGCQTKRVGLDGLPVSRSRAVGELGSLHAAHHARRRHATAGVVGVLRDRGAVDADSRQAFGAVGIGPVPKAQRIGNSGQLASAVRVAVGPVAGIRDRRDLVAGAPGELQRPSIGMNDRVELPRGAVVERDSGAVGIHHPHRLGVGAELHPVAVSASDDERGVGLPDQGIAGVFFVVGENLSGAARAAVPGRQRDDSAGPGDEFVIHWRFDAVPGAADEVSARVRVGVRDHAATDVDLPVVLLGIDAGQADVEGRNPARTEDGRTRTLEVVDPVDRELVHARRPEVGLEQGFRTA